MRNAHTILASTIDNHAIITITMLFLLFLSATSAPSGDEKGLSPPGSEKEGNKRNTRERERRRGGGGREREREGERERERDDCGKHMVVMLVVDGGQIRHNCFFFFTIPTLLFLSGRKTLSFY
jgi:hypothetical protein